LSNITFRDVSKSYGDQVVLEDFDMSVGSGMGKIILGAGGSGKSTILKMIPGLVLPDRGKVLIEDKEISSLKEDEMMPFRSRIGIVFQEGALFDSLSVFENVAYRLREHTTMSEESLSQNVQKALGFVGLADSSDKMPSELSGGMKKRVAIARAMVGNPKIILYDEPTAGLDPITSRSICNLIMRLRDIRKITSVMVTNDLGAAQVIAAEKVTNDRDGKLEFSGQNDADDPNTDFLVLHQGKIRFEGLQSSLDDSDDPYIREFLD